MSSIKQQKIIEASEPKIVVNACAACGKTMILTERVKYLLTMGVSPNKMVVITFTNNAAEEMKSRIGSIGKEVFIGTIHSYANYLLMSKGIDTTKYIKNEDFDGMFGLLQSNQFCIREVEHLLLDEAQDCNGPQLQFLFDVVKPHNFFVVGDYRQSIYEFNGARPDLFLELSSLPEVKTYDLNENYRNGQQILSYAKWILSAKANIYSENYYYADNSKCCTKTMGNKTELVYDMNDITNLINSKDTYKDWFILTRTNEQLTYIKNLIEKRKIPYDTFRQAELTNAELKERMEANTVKILTIHSSKGLEANNVIVIGGRFYDECECRISYVAATRAKDLLVWVKGTQERRKKITQNKITNWE